jgi:hypothetical protein
MGGCSYDGGGVPLFAALIAMFASGVGAPPGKLEPIAGVGGGCGVARPWYRSAETRSEVCLVTPLSSSRACAMGSRSSSGSGCLDCLFLSGEATSKTLLPTLSWKFARGSTGSGLAERGASWITLRSRPKGRVGLTFSSVVLLVAGAQVLRALGVMVGGSLSCLLFLRPKGLLKNPRFFCIDVSSTGLRERRLWHGLARRRRSTWRLYTGE